MAADPNKKAEKLVDQARADLSRSNQFLINTIEELSDAINLTSDQKTRDTLSFVKSNLVKLEVEMVKNATILSPIFKVI